MCFLSITLPGILIWMGMTSIFMLVIMIVYILFFGGTIAPFYGLLFPNWPPT